MVKSKDKLLSEILWVAELEEIRRIDSLPDINFEHSEKYKSFLNKLFETTRKEEDNRKRAKKRKTFFIAALVALLLLTITACSVITPVREFIVEMFEKYTQIVSNKGLTQIEQKYELTYVPAGYLIDDKSTIDTVGMYEKQYKNGDKCLFFTMLVGSSITMIDSENKPTVELDLDGKTVYVFTKWETNIALWLDENYKYCISYPDELDFSEVEKMIRSVKAE